MTGHTHICRPSISTGSVIFNSISKENVSRSRNEFQNPWRCFYRPHPPKGTHNLRLLLLSAGSSGDNSLRRSRVTSSMVNLSGTSGAPPRNTMRKSSDFGGRQSVLCVHQRPCFSNLCAIFFVPSPEKMMHFLLYLVEGLLSFIT